MLIISRAERLKMEFFEELALLADMELDGRKLISILLVGEREWTESSMQQNADKISNTIKLVCTLDPLNREETGAYIEYCLASCGTAKPIFNEKAVHEIFLLSRGNFRLINSICDCALRKGYSYGKKSIAASIIKECGKELRQATLIEEASTPRDDALFQNTEEDGQNRDGSLKTSSGKWFWVKALMIVLFLFSSYLLYKSHDENTGLWQAEEIAKKEYDFHKLKEEEINDSDTTQGPDENSPPPTSAATNSDSNPSNHQKPMAADANAAENNSDFQQAPDKNYEWPFPTFKKIIYFQYDSNTLPPESLEILDKIAEFAIHNPDREYIVKGYTDSTGVESYNLTISKQRADAVKKLFGRQGCRSHQIENFRIGIPGSDFFECNGRGQKIESKG